MPFNIEVVKPGNGHRRKMPGGWDQTALDTVMTVALAESHPDAVLAANGWSMEKIVEEGKVLDWSMFPIYYMGSQYPECGVLNSGSQRIKQDYRFEFCQDPDDPERVTRVIEFKAGDEIRAWRSMK